MSIFKKINLEHWYLDFVKTNELDDIQADQIHSYYKDMLHLFETNCPASGLSIFLTLEKNAFRKNVRDKKLDDILND